MNEFPLIGLTSYSVPLDRHPGYSANGVMTLYRDAVINAGGVPVLLPVNPDHRHLASALGRLDGLLLVGGGDVHPRRYGMNIIDDLVYGVDEDRDEMECFLACQALAMDMPMLAICRGHQLLNVAMGGTLWQDVKHLMPGGHQHSWFGENRPRHELPHAVTISAESRLADLLGTTKTPVNSIHHQGVDKLADGLVATAFAEDGLIEGYEMPDKRFVVGVQWHPEAIVDHVAGQKGLFTGLVASAKTYRD